MLTWASKYHSTFTSTYIAKLKKAVHGLGTALHAIHWSLFSFFAEGHDARTTIVTYVCCSRSQKFISNIRPKIRSLVVCTVLDSHLCLNFTKNN